MGCIGPGGSGRRQRSASCCALAGMGGEGAATVADIAKAMAKSRTSDISVARNELIKKGLVYAPERGLLAFTVPGMHDFIDRQP